MSRLFTFVCDNCGAFDDVRALTMESAFIRVEKYGWIIEGNGREITCPECAEKEE